MQISATFNNNNSNNSQQVSYVVGGDATGNSQQQHQQQHQQHNEMELQSIAQERHISQGGGDGTMLSGANEDINNRESDYAYSQSSGQNGSSYQSKKYKILDLFLLRDSNGQKSINRVCCIKIKKNWTIRKQMIISLMVLSCSVFLLVILIVIGNLLLTRYLIRKSSEDAIHQQIQENLRNSAKEYSNAILEIFHGQSSKLEILTRIVLSAMKEDDQIFDFDYVQEFPIIGRGEYADLTGVPAADVDTSDAVKADYGDYQVTFKYWQWGSYDQTTALTQITDLSTDSQKIAGAADVLNYFLEDFFFDKNVTYIHYIYMVFENLDSANGAESAQQDVFSIWYPGGINTGLYPKSQLPANQASSAYNPMSSVWYTSTKDNFALNATSTMILTGPYLDSDTKLKTLTISKAIVNQYTKFRGVASIDMLVSDLQTIIDRVKFYTTGFLMLVNLSNGEILNDPYKSATVYKIYDSAFSKFTYDQWVNVISNKVDYAEDQILNIVNTEGEQILIMRNFIEGQIQGENYILIVQVPEKEAYHFLYDLADKMFETFQTIQIITICTILFTCSIAIMCGCCYSNRIVKPLTKLTEYAKSINSNATKKSLTQDIKIDLDEIKASDKIGELIDAFKNLVKGLSGLKKGARTEMAAGNEKINFPINFYYGTKMKWRGLLDQLKAQEESQKNATAAAAAAAAAAATATNAPNAADATNGNSINLFQQTTTTSQGTKQPLQQNESDVSNRRSSSAAVVAGGLQQGASMERTNTALSSAAGFADKMKLIDDEIDKQIFPDFKIKTD